MPPEDRILPFCFDPEPVVDPMLLPLEFVPEPLLMLPLCGEGMLDEPVDCDGMLPVAPVPIVEPAVPDPPVPAAPALWADAAAAGSAMAATAIIKMRIFFSPNVVL